jgi:large subunit ribosomal protein L10
MSKVQPAKVATIDEVKTRIAASTTAVVTEYRGLTVAQISTLRRQLRTLGADYKVFKNTLVLRAIAGTDVESLAEYLVGPTAIAFVDGDVSAVAKALRDFARETPKLIVKGGVVDGKPLTKADLSALADLPSRDVLLAQIAGLLASPLRTLAALLQAVPQNFAYGLSALIEARGGAPVPAEDKVEEVAETPAGVEEAAPAASDDDATPVAEVAVEDEAPAAESDAEAPVEEEAPAAEPEAEAPVEEEAPAAEPEAALTEAPVEDAAAEPAE